MIPKDERKLKESTVQFCDEFGILRQINKVRFHIFFVRRMWLYSVELSLFRHISAIIDAIYLKPICKNLVGDKEKISYLGKFSARYLVKLRMCQFVVERFHCRPSNKEKTQ